MSDDDPLLRAFGRRTPSRKAVSKRGSATDAAMNDAETAGRGDDLLRAFGEPRDRPPSLWSNSLRYARPVLVLTATAVLVVAAAGRLTHNPSTPLSQEAEQARVSTVLSVEVATLPTAPEGQWTWGGLFLLYGIPDAYIPDSIKATKSLSDTTEPRDYIEEPVTESSINLVL